jgi:hypothetical protein
MVASTGNFREICDVTRLAAEMQVPVMNVGNFICADPQPRQDAVEREGGRNTMRCLWRLKRKRDLTTTGAMQRWPSMAACKVCTVFTPFDSIIARISAFLFTNEDEVLIKRGLRPGNRREAEIGA